MSLRGLRTIVAQAQSRKEPMQKPNGMLTILTAAFVAAACSEMKSPTKPGATALATEQATEASDAAALAAVRQATAAFHDVDQAIAAGYASPFSGHCEATAAGAMGVHSVNAALMQTPALIPEQPEVAALSSKRQRHLPAGGSGIHPDSAAAQYADRTSSSMVLARTLACRVRRRQSHSVTLRAKLPRSDGRARAGNALALRLARMDVGTQSERHVRAMESGARLPLRRVNFETGDALANPTLRRCEQVRPPFSRLLLTTGLGCHAGARCMRGGLT